MKRLEIFKAGTQTAASGETLSFTEDHLRATVEAYDPAVHEAPIVVGHPKDNAPAYGWIKSLQFDEGGKLFAETDQVMPEFADMVKAGRFKKRSASFYKPDSPANPKPGVYYLRHVGFLGAQPPAVKGLADPEFKEGKLPSAVEFSGSDADVVEFSDSYILAGLFRRMREFFIERFGSEDADRVMPSFLIEDLEAQARQETEPAASFEEQQPTDQQPTGEPEMTPEQIAELQAKAAKADALEAENAKLKAKEAEFAERERKLARAEIEKSVDALIKDGKVLPAERQAMVDYLESLDSTKELDFSEGEGETAKTVKRTQRAQFLELLSKRPPMVDFQERSADTDNDIDSADFREIAEAAAAYRERELKEGRTISATEAVNAVRAGKHKEK